MSKQPLDFTAFTDPLATQEARASLSTWEPILWLVERLPVWALFGLMIGPLFVLTALHQIYHFSIATGNKLYMGAIGLSIIALYLLLTRRKLYDANEAVRLRKFADLNHFTYQPSRTDPVLNGMVFNNGTQRISEDIIEGSFGGAQFELGNFGSYVRRSGSKASKEMYGYAWTALPRRLPHMVLDSKRDNYLGLTSMADDFSGEQKLQLEGDFNTYFTLYCPKEYERDALYVFTPDLMQLLVDHGNTFDVEVIDDRLYLYKFGGFNFTTQHHAQIIFEALALIGKRMRKQAVDYADARVGDRAANIIAEPGRKLKRGYVTALLAILFGLVTVLIRFLLGDV